MKSKIYTGPIVSKLNSLYKFQYRSSMPNLIEIWPVHSDMKQKDRQMGTQSPILRSLYYFVQITHKKFDFVSVVYQPKLSPMHLMARVPVIPCL
jgi:hypothetical protein